MRGKEKKQGGPYSQTVLQGRSSNDSDAESDGSVSPTALKQRMYRSKSAQNMNRFLISPRSSKKPKEKDSSQKDASVSCFDNWQSLDFHFISSARSLSLFLSHPFFVSHTHSCSVSLSLSLSIVCAGVVYGCVRVRLSKWRISLCCVYISTVTNESIAPTLNSYTKL